MAISDGFSSAVMQVLEINPHICIKIGKKMINRTLEASLKFLLGDFR